MPVLFESLQKSQYDWEYYAESDACLAHSHGCFWPRGKLLGGSSGINAMFYVRGVPNDYNRWAELGNPTWDWEHALKYFKKSEGNQNTDFVNYKNGKYHSDKGPQFIDSHGEVHPISKIFYEAGQERGIKYVDDINADESLGYVNSQSYIFKGRRQSAAKSFLVPNKNRPNLHIVKHAHVRKININKDNVVTGVEFRYKGKQTLTAKSRKEVIVSAGAVSSPQLLMLSGIGPKEHLNKHNIKVKRDAAVGKNLMDHIYTALFFQFHRSSPIQEAQTDILDAIYNFAIHSSGPLTHLGPSQLTAMLNTANGTGDPDIQHHFLFMEQNSWKLPGHLKSKKYDESVERALLEANTKADIGIVWVTLLQPKSVGFIELKSTSADDKPRIVANYFEDAEDMTTMLRAVKQQIGFEDTDTYRKHEGEFLRIPLKNCDQFEFKSDDYLRCYIRHFSSTLYHPVGTSKMGPDSDPEAVVDPRLKVKGVKALRQIDAGISKSSEIFNFSIRFENNQFLVSVPKLVSANTAAASVMIGERGADFIKEDYMREPKTEL